MKEHDKYELGLDIHITSKLIKRYLDNNCPIQDINGGQIRVIAIIKDREAAGLDTYQKDIEAGLAIRRSSVTSVLQLMEKNGYIERESVSTDARLKKLVLTDKGQEADRLLRQNLINTENAVKSALSEEELEIVKNALQKIKNVIQEGESI